MSLLRKMLGQPRDTQSLIERARGDYLIKEECDPWAHDVCHLIRYVEAAEAAEGRTNGSYSASVRSLVRIALGEETLPEDPNA